MGLSMGLAMGPSMGLSMGLSVCLSVCLSVVLESVKWVDADSSMFINVLGSGQWVYANFCNDFGMDWRLGSWRDRVFAIQIIAKVDARELTRPQNL